MGPCLASLLMTSCHAYCLQEGGRLVRWDPSKGLTPPLCETRISLERVWLPAVLSAHSLSQEAGNFLNKGLQA